MDLVYSQAEIAAYHRLYLANEKLTKARKALDAANIRLQAAHEAHKKAWDAWQEIHNKIKPLE